MPSQLRRMVRDKGRDLHAEFLSLLPERPRPISIQRWSLRRVALALVVVLGLVIASPVVAHWSVQTNRISTSLHTGNVDCFDREALWLMAQAVPSASLVPCVQLLPAGWSVNDVKVEDGNASITFDSDRSGVGAVMVQLAASCDLAGAVELSSERPTARRYLRVEPDAAGASVDRVYTFPGGCVTQRLVAPPASRQQLASEASFALGFTTRETLKRSLDQRSGGRLELDVATR